MTDDSTKHAGRPENSGPYHEKTVPMRIPLSLVEPVKKMLEAAKNPVK